jgi:hypothetical protein
LKYRIALRAKSPSDAIIEALVTKELDTGEWTVSGEIERNNRCVCIKRPKTDMAFLL